MARRGIPGSRYRLCKMTFIFFWKFFRQFSKKPKVSGKVFDLGPGDADRALVEAHALSWSAARIDAALAKSFLEFLNF